MDFSQTAGRIEKLLASRPLDGWEIYLQSSRNLALEVKEGEVDTFRCAAPVGASLRVLKNGAMGFSYSTSLDEADLARMIDSALVGAETQTADEYQALPLPALYPELAGLFDEGLTAVPEKAKIERALELERLVLAADPRVKRVRKASYGENAYSVFIRNSHGVAGEYRGTSVSSSVSVVAEANGDSQMGWDFGFSTRFDGVDVAIIARSAAGKATGLLGATPVASMRCPVILQNGVAADILELLAPSFLAESIQKGKSMLAGKEGESIFSPLLRIRDDGVLPGGMASAPFDGEGVPQRNTLLAADGRLLGYLYDTYTAAKDGKESTGNSTRSGVKGTPHPGVNNFFIENGTAPFNALLADVQRGVVITDVMGMHTANPISGDFSVGAAGFLVEGGVITRPVKGIAISGNILELFRTVDVVADDLRFFGAVGSPSLRIEALDVSGS